MLHFFFLLRKLDLADFSDATTAIDTASFNKLRENFQQQPSSFTATLVSQDKQFPRSADYFENLKALEKALNAKSCQRQRQRQQQQQTNKDDYILNGDFCSETTSTQFIYYNSLPFDRIVCGETISPDSYIIMPNKCHTPARLFAEIPHRTGKQNQKQNQMKPVHLSFTPPSTSTTNRRARPFPCDVPCHSIEGGGVVKTRYVTPIDNSEPWKISFSMEGPVYYRQLAIREGAYKKHLYYSTTSYESEIPLPYFSWEEYDIQSPQPVDFDTAIKGASFMAKNCASKNKREHLVQELSQHFRVDALSSCLHNADPPPGANLRDKIQTMRFYLFHLAFENQCYPDYITEKLWGPMQSGTIPVYYGSPNVKEHAPNNSLILVDDFPNAQALGEYLNRVANNRTLFEFHQQWRKEPLPPHFHARYDFTQVHSTCRTCRWAYSKFYGLGWNHGNQSLRELETPRYPCVNHDGQLAKPFTEQWLSNTTLAYSGPAQLTCYETESEDLAKSELVIDGALRRVAWQQDGVIDMLIDALHPDAVSVPRTLQIGTPLPGAEEMSMQQIETGHVRIQNGKTRFTVLAWPKRNLELRKNDAGGIIEISIDERSHLPLKLRVVVEDVDTFRKGADQDENFFGGLMKRDFFNPVEILSS